MTKVPNAIDLQVGANMRFLRVRLSISQETLAEHLGVAFQQVQKYEKAANRISASKIVMTCRLFGCPIVDLFYGVEDVDLGAVTTPRAKDQSSTAIKAMKLFDTIPGKQRTALLALIRSLAVSDLASEDEDGSHD
ncbi:helix-turn-helix transcriptional regulator [Rhizobium sp. B230/85]|uniref:helix-turn-helix domain-containing protein n=1 Tax=unclassified Rhizobium TaxID=2613769 RepID=UPI001ADD0757|nr:MULTISPECIES: helix-turn-helix transcriptional regulator [unclassified Rhizobium]MBO9134557.1 helix-turn-helix transcriptional regulator [Rhizobium sp. B209b/85]QXZ98480.1 helix-turn-helix transcriptional regulator [Rhizobium sp. B230/85]